MAAVPQRDATPAGIAGSRFVSDREKVSFSELDRIRREKRSGEGQQRSRNDRSQRRSRSAVSAYKRKIEDRLFGRGPDAAKLRLIDRLRESHGSESFRATYKEYLRNYGLPEDVPLLLLLLDLEDEREVLKVLNALGAAADSAQPEQRSLLRSRLRNLELSTSSDRLADRAAELVSQL